MTKTFRTLDDVDVKGKRVLLRVDLNVPVYNGKPGDLTRIERMAPAVAEIAANGGKVILLSHCSGMTVLWIYSFLPIATAVSAMRLEKPHSLSYQDITRTSVPFNTLVWSIWKVEECGSWLKSIETLGCVV